MVGGNGEKRQDSRYVKNVQHVTVTERTKESEACIRCGAESVERFAQSATPPPSERGALQVHLKCNHFLTV